MSALQMCTLLLILVILTLSPLHGGGIYHYSALKKDCLTLPWSPFLGYCKGQLSLFVFFVSLWMWWMQISIKCWTLNLSHSSFFILGLPSNTVLSEANCVTLHDRRCCWNFPFFLNSLTSAHCSTFVKLQTFVFFLLPWHLFDLWKTDKATWWSQNHHQKW